MLLLCALVVGSNVWAAEVTDTYTFTSKSWTAKCSEGSNPVVEESRFNWTSGKDGAEYDNNGVKVTTAATGANATSPKSYTNISKIVVTYNTNKSAGKGTLAIKIGENSETTKEWKYSGSSDGRSAYFTTEFDYANPQSGNVKLTANTTTNSIYVVRVAITYNSENTNPKTETTTTIDATALSNTNVFGGNTTGGTLTATVHAGETTVEGASVTWSSSNTGVATIDENGVVTLVAAGTTTFTAAYAGDETFASSSDTYELTVTNDDPDAITIWSEDFSSYSANDVPSGGTYGYSCTNGGGTTKIYAANNAGGTSPELLVAKTYGTFTAVVPLNNASGTLTLTYKTNAKALSVSTTTDGINGGGSFSTAGEHTVTFTDVTTDMTSITIVFTATGSDNVRLDDIVLKGRAEAVAIKAPVFSINGGTYYTAQTVELTCETEGATIYYSTDGTNWLEYTEALTISTTTTLYAKAVKGSDESTPTSITITIAEKNDVVFSIADSKTLTCGETYTVTRGTSSGRDVQTDGYVTLSTDNTAVASVSGMTITANAVGTAVITISAAEGDTYKAGTKDITFIITSPEGQTTAPEVPALFKETFDKCDGSGGRDNTFTGNVGTSSTTDKLDETWSIIGNNGAYHCIKLGTGSASGLVTTRKIALSGNGTLTFSAAGWNTGTNTISVMATGATLSGDTEVSLENGTWNNYSVDVTGASGEVSITFSMQRGFLDDITVVAEGAAAPAITVTLNASGFATYCSQYPLDFSEATDYTAWQVTGVDGADITFDQITGSVKGGTGIFLKGEAGETITLKYANSTTELSGNKLIGILAPTYVVDDDADYNFFGLSGNQFKEINPGTVPANKAILKITREEYNAIPDAARLRIVFNDASGISTVMKNGDDANSVYDLQGRRVMEPTKGLYIMNGKKVMVK